jgi:hypothetical protein
LHGGERMTTATNQANVQPIPTVPVICDACRAHGTAGEGGFAGIADILNFEPVPRRTQVNNWTPELQRAFVAALAITGSERRAGKAIGRHEYGAQKLRKARGERASIRRARRVCKSTTTARWRGWPTRWASFRT